MLTCMVGVVCARPGSRGGLKEGRHVIRGNLKRDSVCTITGR